jgi:hypothetical protein
MHHSRGAVVRRIASILLLGLLLSGCAGVPSQEMSDARRALAAAEQADARRHAAALLARGQRALREAETALAGADYGEARARALSARAVAIEARFVSRELATTLQVIERARGEGRPVGGALELVQRAREAVRAGQVERALEMLSLAQVLAG